MSSSSIGSSSCHVKFGPTEHTSILPSTCSCVSETFQDCQHQFVLTVMFWLCTVFRTENFPGRPQCIESCVSHPVTLRATNSIAVTNRFRSSGRRLSSENADNILGLRMPSMTRFRGNVHKGCSCGRPPLRDTFCATASRCLKQCVRFPSNSCLSFERFAWSD